MLSPCGFIVITNGRDFFLGNIESIGPVNVAVRESTGLLNFIGSEGGEKDLFQGIGVNNRDVEVSEYFFNERKELVTVTVFRVVSYGK